MPRRGRAPARSWTPDPVYNSVLVTRLTNKVMYDGKKSLARKLVYRAMDIIREKTGKDPLEVLDQAVKNAMPVLEVRPRRVGGATYQVPIEVRNERRLSLAIRWLVDFARERSERGFENRLAAEIMDAAGNTGNTVRRKEEMHKMAEANRAFAHYRW
ncbi:MAG TPA: 30S ribosomal protein S7 [Firmicutes bacterium]|uniref:Small ribosomal subunit protein uS7 n=1 Tax=Candidatus Fermentithermobacillus carboniphilus TaxID=3085328 RepID=A0AAT9LB22_9FIRM|nr:MAG: 30S ribosomal protein S7 [Candidatus Fermentithermobacillus carboniphilus]HHW18394.1 30S ribosomal protein S7 [Candidatus Fermentithermobacillaceae bacterium]